jgi:hypothetical protein
MCWAKWFSAKLTLDMGMPVLSFECPIGLWMKRHVHWNQGKIPAMLFGLLLYIRTILFSQNESL